jgi:hypothetical protein
VSREFGSYEPGYFHYQIDLAAQDCRGGHDEMTRLWGEFLAVFRDVSYAIASSEAGDSSESFTVKETIKAMPKMREALDQIEKCAQEKSNPVNTFDEREKRLILNCVDYAKNDPAGVPGHNLMVIIAKMANLLYEK